MLLGEIQKNSVEKIRVSSTSYQGHSYIDIRVYFEDDQGEWRPTKKGVTISPSNVDDVIKILKKVNNYGL